MGPLDGAGSTPPEDVVRYLAGFFTGAVTEYAIVPVLSVAWDMWKRVDPFPPPMGESPASAPSQDQLIWALRGCNIGFVKDAEHADQMVWGYAMNRYISTSVTIPAVPT